jgi:hypothetical protein
MTAILHAEWLKVRSVRSTMWILFALGLFVCLVAWIAWYGANTPGAVPQDARMDYALGVQARITGDVAGLCCAVLAVLAITSEYTTGTIRTTFVAMPRRRSVLAAKAAVVAAVAALAGLASVSAAYGVTRAIFKARLPDLSLPAVADELPGLLALSLSVVMYALLALGLATIMRSAPAAIGTFVAVWYLAPMMAIWLPAPWDQRIGSVLPGALSGQLGGFGNANSVFGALLSPSGAGVAMAAYMVVPLAVAAVLLHRRDA